MTMTKFKIQENITRELNRDTYLEASEAVITAEASTAHFRVVRERSSYFNEWTITVYSSEHEHEIARIHKYGNNEKENIDIEYVYIVKDIY